jgi:DNA invertase Pin-like site-specific DNA recombinase
MRRIVGVLDGQGVAFRSLTESIDTTGGGKLVFHVVAALAEFERDLIRERTLAGLVAARVRRVQGADHVTTKRGRAVVAC